MLSSFSASVLFCQLKQFIDTSELLIYFMELKHCKADAVLGVC